MKKGNPHQGCSGADKPNHNTRPWHRPRTQPGECPGPPSIHVHSHGGRPLTGHPPAPLLLMHTPGTRPYSEKKCSLTSGSRRAATCQPRRSRTKVWIEG